jgi:thioredoxin reductase (NADPH)
MSLILTVHALLFALAIAASVFDALNNKRKISANRDILARRGGDDATPPTLHPVINPDVCMGSAACVRACPEKRALVVVDGRAHLGDPGGCVGHGMCAAACPVGAISLVFGTARRGVDLPVVDAEFRSQRPGVFIAGELGGMGLVANAARQGVKAARFIRDDLREAPAVAEDVLQLLIVGAGPAGIAATLAAKEAGLRYRTVDRSSDLGGAIRTYPRGKVVMTSPVELPGYGKVRLRRTSKEALLELFEDVVSRVGVALEFGVEVQGLQEECGVFVVDTNRGPVRAQRVLLAIGRRGRPRALGVEGEARALRALNDPAEHRGRSCVVLGGGDSAVEAALALASEPGTSVALVHRGARFDRVKPDNRARLEAAEAQGALRVVTAGTLRAIGAADVVVRTASGEELTLPAASLFAMIGTDLPTELLSRSGIAVKTWHGEPVA